MIGTLTSSILKSVHTLISLIFSYKLCSVATPGHPEPFPLENHGRIVALTPDLQRVSFYSVIGFPHHSPTIELILSLILIKGSYLSFKASHLCRKSSSVLWLLGGANSCMIATRICTSDQSETILVWCETTPQYLRFNFNYKALGTNANSGWRWCQVRHI